MNEMQLIDINIVSVGPEIILLAAGILFLFFKLFPAKLSRYLSVPAMIILFCLFIFLPFFRDNNVAGFAGAIKWDNTSLLFYILLLFAALLAIMFSHGKLKDNERAGEFYFLLYVAQAGMILMVTARDLLIVFLSMEILSVSLYVLVGMFRAGKAQMEAMVKYFLLGSFSSAVFLMGLALIYGASGATHFDSLYPATISSLHMLALFYIGVVMVLAGLGFKIAAVPFHMWAPDAYEGADESVAAFLAAAPKIAAFAVIYRLGMIMNLYTVETLTAVIVVMSAGSMVLGNLAALKQTMLIRMLAYSGIAQVGYMLIGILVLPQSGAAALLFYLFVYVFMNMGAFGIAVFLSREKGGNVAIDDLAGLAKGRPLVAFAMAVFMISLAGIPPTGGFFAKFYIFKSGIEAGYLGVVIIAVIATVVSLYYYFRVIMAMYMQEKEEGARWGSAGFDFLPAVLFLCAFALLACGLIAPHLLSSLMPGEAH